MWIKKMRKKLYGTLVLRMLAALILSVFIFAGLVNLGQELIFSSDLNIQTDITNNKFLLSSVNALADDTQEEMLDKGMTFYEADRKVHGRRDIDVLIGDSAAYDYFYGLMLDRGHKDHSEDEEPLSLIQGKTKGGLVYYTYMDAILYEISDGKEDGYALITLSGGGALRFFGTLLSMIVSISFFFILSIQFIKPIIVYIKELEGGIQSMASGNLAYRVPVRGDHELAKLADSINKMGQEIQDKTEHEKMIDQNQRTLITNISHDLRTPLTSMIGYVDLIESHSQEAQVVDYAGVAKKNALRLENLINDLFLYTKLTSDDVTYDLVKVDLSLIIRQMLEMRTRSISLNYSPDSYQALVDVDKFHRLMDNLLSNAEKHGLDQEPIHIDLMRVQDQVVIEVTNKTKEDLRNQEAFLLDRLYVGNQERKEGSSGLGLSIAHELVERMDGSIQVKVDKDNFKVVIQFNHLL